MVITALVAVRELEMSIQLLAGVVKPTARELVWAWRIQPKLVGQPRVIWLPPALKATWRLGGSGFMAGGATTTSVPLSESQLLRITGAVTVGSVMAAKLLVLMA